MKRLTPSILMLLAMCQAPESTRVVGGRGADIGNRTPDVEMHGGSRMYNRTPCYLPEELCPGPLPSSGLTKDFPQR